MVKTPEDIFTYLQLPVIYALLRLFEDLHRQGHTLIVVTHDDAIAAHARREVRLRDGLVESDRVTAGTKGSTQ